MQHQELGQDGKNYHTKIMARTFQEIEQSINDEIAQEPSLTQINTLSLLGVLMAIKRVVARAIQTLENLWDAFLAELDKRAAEAVTGSPRWYNDRAREFQYGDQLTEKDGKLFYAVVDETKRIVKYAAVTEIEELTQIKIAKDAAGEYVPLTNDELIAFKRYISDIKFSGTKTQIISVAADLVWPVMTIYYDAKLIGKLETLIKPGVEAAINGHLKGIYFDGKFNLNTFRDSIEKAPGLVAGGVDLTSVKIKSSAGAYVSVTREYAPLSGYYKIDPAHPITDVAQVKYVAV